MVRDMATSKHKSAPAAKKKAAVARTGKAKKPAAKKPVALKKSQPRKIAKPVKPVKKSASKKSARKVASARKTPAVKARRPAAVVKPQRPAKKMAAKPATKARPTKSSASKSALKKNPAPVVAKTQPAGKPASTKQAVPTKGKMASAVAKTPDTVTREDGRYALPSTVVIDLPANYRPKSSEAAEMARGSGRGIQADHRQLAR